MKMSDMNHVQVVLTKKDNLKKVLSGIDVSAIQQKKEKIYGFSSLIHGVLRS